MELDDLRGQWQQRTAAADAAVLFAVPKEQPGLIEKMRRNAQWELALTIVIAFGLPIFIALTKIPIYRLWAAVMLLLAGIMLFYYYQKLVTLGRMLRVDGSVQGHLQVLCGGLRALLLFYHRLTLATGPTMLLLLLGYYVGRELARATPFRWGRIGGMTLFVLIFGLLLQLVVIYGTRWYLQRLYGQHLDHLETALRELSAGEAK